LGTAPPPPAADIVAAPRGPQASLASERSTVAVDLPPTPATVAPLVPLAPGAYRAARDRAPAATYQVQPRDTLVSIARQLYGDESRFQEIYEANRALIPDPNNLRAGVVLRIP
ncbi:MAG: LysM peptidoglycan-binding domain-containing protein, partial [Planctomycetaceae bacterium]|nr:LysM peptidoglycan-binding domain-containing protein [Planctomycetaceae bacterium]